MTSSVSFPLEGGCACRKVRYRMDTAPLIVNSCHCRWCQRETGTAFATNALIEHDRVTVLVGEPMEAPIPSESGRGQVITRCPTCFVTLWSNYSNAGPLIRVVRVGTLDHPGYLPPMFHIYTASKQPWVILPSNSPAFPEHYDYEQYWPAESLKRRRAHFAQAKGS